jgi:uncharacterized protein YbjT (DUF2867 family)
MKIVVVGGTGRLGSQIVAELQRRGHDVVPASPSTGFDTISGTGVAEGVAGADAVIDVSNAPSFEAEAVRAFFSTSTGTLLAAERTAGVGHHLLLSIVGADEAPDSGYLSAKIVQEDLVRDGGVPFTIVRATQFMEFLGQIADSFEVEGTVRAPSAHLQPIAVADLAAAVADVVEGPPTGGVIEVGGPDSVGLDELIRRVFASTGDARPVVTDDEVRYFGQRLGPTTLTPGDGARLAPTHLDAWLQRS